MTANTDEKQLTEEELVRLRDAGLPPELIAVARHEPESVGEKRNSVREQARRAVRNQPDASGEELVLYSYGGDYFEALCEGDLGGAFIRADIANTRILLDIFSRNYLIERLISDNAWSEARASEMVDQRIESYGDGRVP